MKTMNFEVGTDGIALLTINDPDRSVNVVTPEWIDEMFEVIDKVAADDAIKGVIVTSGKPAFMAGADLKYFLSQMEAEMSLQEACAFSQRATDMHRRMETSGKPWVAAINGYALGGGYELCLACHHRVLVDDPRASVGLPEVTVGLLAGSGGTQRLPRMVGVENALPLVVEGKTQGPQEALKLGMVDEVVPADQLLDAARAWLKTDPDPVRFWDKKGYEPPEGKGLLNAKISATYTMWVARIVSKNMRNYPAPLANLDVIFEGMVMPMDKALGYESKRFAQLVTGSVARNIIRTGFVNKGNADKLIRRPEGVPKYEVKKVGVLGAGLMGSGIAHVAAKAGIDVVLLDNKLELAEKGKNYSEKVVAKAMDKGRMKQDKADALLSRITPTADYADLQGCDLVVEAVFEDMGVKADVTRKAEAVIPEGAIFASNTSTLPITGLAEASSRPDRFIGLHFFSPVERMPLIEVISGRETSDETLAQALDFVGQLRMTPVLVNDSRGFYTSRVFQTFIHEGMRMLEEGIEPARIENAAKIVGMPMGPLALTDDLTVELPWKIVQQSIEAEGDNYKLPCAYNVMKLMVEDLGRIGRRAGAGFYEYPEAGGRRLWSGLGEHFPVADEQPEVEELGKRFLYTQALETARCFEEGVVTDAADADLGAILGWGFPRYTGGTLSLIDTVGVQAFVAECERMAKQYGERFKPSAWMRQRALDSEPFYPRSR